jgi:hypothetical protein
MLGNGAINLTAQQNQDPRKSVGGYFQSRIATAFSAPQINPDDYLSTPNTFNDSVPSNIDLLAGDQLVEVQTNSIAKLSNTALPGIDPWLSVIDWINDFINASNNRYDDIFIDINPSFAIYTQFALASCRIHMQRRNIVSFASTEEEARFKIELELQKYNNPQIIDEKVIVAATTSGGGIQYTIECWIYV